MTLTCGDGLQVLEDGVELDPAAVSLDFLEPDAALLAALAPDGVSVNMALYALLSGRSGGQVLHGGSGAGELLTLRGNAPDVGGIVRVDSELSVGPPQGTPLVFHAVAQGAVPSIFQVGLINTTMTLAGAGLVIFGLEVAGNVNLNGNNLLFMDGLFYSPGLTGTGAELVSTWRAMRSRLAVTAPAPTVTGATALSLEAGNLALLAGLTTIDGLHVFDLSAGLGETAYGVRVDDFLGAGGVKNLVEIGPVAPYFRVVGGVAPAAGFSTVFADFGGVGLRAFEVDAVNTAGAGFRNVRVAN